MRLLKIKPFKTLDNWGVKAAMTKSVSFTPEYPTLRVGDIVERVKDVVRIKDDEWYEAVKVKYYNGGVESRGKQQGKDIKSKRQFKVSESQIVVSKIDARFGAIGLIPSNLEGAIITNNFIVYKVDTKKAAPEFLALLLTSEAMIRKMAEDSSGATRRVYLQEDKFLAEPIALPSIDIQRKLADEYDKIMSEAKAAEESLEKLSTAVKQEILKDVNVWFSILVPTKGLLYTVSLKEITRWDVGYYKQQCVLTSGYRLLSLRDCVSFLMVDEKLNSLRTDANSLNEGCKYIGMDAIEKGTGQAFVPLFQDATKMRGEMIRVPKGFFIFGKLRPYLNKFWLNRTEKNIVCSSEFLVFRLNDKISAEYFEALLYAEVVKKQVVNIASGARMPRVKENDLMGVQIPVPPMQVQRSAAKAFAGLLSKKSKLEVQAENYRREARKTFDEALFNEVKTEAL